MWHRAKHSSMTPSTVVRVSSGGAEREATKACGRHSAKSTVLLGCPQRRPSRMRKEHACGPSTVAGARHPSHTRSDTEVARRHLGMTLPKVCGRAVLLMLTLTLLATPADCERIMLLPRRNRTRRNNNNVVRQRIILKPRHRAQSIEAADPSSASTPLVVRPRPAPRTPVDSAAAIPLPHSGTPVTVANNGLLRMPDGTTVLRLSHEDALKLSSTADNTPAAEDQVQVYFYDPHTLTTDAGEEPVPPIPHLVYDQDGNQIDIHHLHNGGENDVFLIPPEHEGDTALNHEKSDLTTIDATTVTSDSVSGTTSTSVTSDTTGTTSDSGTTSTTTSSDSPSTTSDTSSGISTATAVIVDAATIITDKIHNFESQSLPQQQDQMIIVSTVATMALLVGALSARRLRSRHFLNSCIENESLEDELAYDTAYTTHSTVGESSVVYGGGYDTFNGRGEDRLRWRGDLEKFDV